MNSLSTSPRAGRTGPANAAARLLHAFLPSNIPSSTTTEGEKTGQIRILLLENISQDAAQYLRDQGYHVDLISKALGEDELIERLSGYQAVGIRSKTKVTERVIKAVPQVSGLLFRKAATSRWLTRIRCSLTPIALDDRMFLYRDEPGRPRSRCQGGYRRLQLSLCQLSFGRRTRHQRDHRPLASTRR